MKPMTRVYPKLRLQAALGDPRGITLESASSRGTVRMETHRDAAYDEIDKALAALKRICGATGEPIDPREVYALAETVVDLAGLFAPSVCRAAQSLCTLAETASKSGLNERASMVVHVEAMQLLRMMSGAETDQTDAVLAGLFAVTAKMKG